MPKKPKMQIYPWKGRWRWVLTDKISGEVLDMGEEKTKSEADAAGHDQQRKW